MPPPYKPIDENGTKRCTRCKHVKPTSKFGRCVKNPAKPRLKPHCKSCDVDRAKEYRKTPAGKASRVVEHRKKFAASIAVYRMVKAMQKCLLCPENDPVCIDFHHLDPRYKRRALVDSLRSSFKALKAEMAKCVCLCANCHRKFHAGRVTLPPGTQTLSPEWLDSCFEHAREAAGLPRITKAIQ